jgi:hypothetical protein
VSLLPHQYWNKSIKIVICSQMHITYEMKALCGHLGTKDHISSRWKVNTGRRSCLQGTTAPEYYPELAGSGCDSGSSSSLACALGKFRILPGEAASKILAGDHGYRNQVMALIVQVKSLPMMERCGDICVTKIFTLYQIIALKI